MKYFFTEWPRLARKPDRTADTLWLFDFDGTLAPIASRPAQAAIPPANRTLLKKLALRFPGRVGVLSGRPLHQLRQKTGFRHFIYAGAQGFDIQIPGFHFRHSISGKRAKAVHALISRWQKPWTAIRGAWVEYKKWTFSFHYRQVKKADQPRIDFLLREIQADADSVGVTTLNALKALEILSDGHWNKGHAALWLKKHLHARRLFFVGDDATDETVFRLMGGSDTGVRVGYQRGSRAAYYLKHQSEMQKLLRRMTSQTIY